MCGVAFIYDPAISALSAVELVKKSLCCMSHRGPDDSGIESLGGAAIGHCRLSIIDVHANKQPMISPDDRYSLSFNGEIYNYKELRRSLHTNWQFKTQGDTEVLLAGLLTQGIEFLRSIEGMFSFVLWNKVDQTLLAARDRFGKKPLYYSHTGGRVSFASEIPALRMLSGTAWTEDSNSTADYLRYGYFMPGHTAFEQVKEVLPSHLLSWSVDKGFKEKSYWSLRTNAFMGSKSDAYEQCRELLTDSVRKRLVADVEVGAFLSGGVDSSLIVALMSQLNAKATKTFSIGFSDKAHDETAFATQISNLYKTSHSSISIDGWDPDRLISIIQNHVGQPFADSSILPTAIVSELASKSVKVALTGDGGDELFSGYSRYKARYLTRWYTRLPKGVRSTTLKLLRNSSDAIPDGSRSTFKSVIRAAEALARIEDETPYVAPLMYSATYFRSLAPEHTSLGHDCPSLHQEHGFDEIMAMMQGDLNIYLPQDILLKVDRSSMISSLEARSPFLDTQLVELAFSLPCKWHRSGVNGKEVLRHSFEELLPNNIWNRPKKGFAVPLQNWFLADMGESLLDLLNSADNALSKSTIRNMLDEHKSGLHNHGYRLWNIYNYLLCKQSVY